MKKIIILICAVAVLVGFGIFLLNTKNNKSDTTSTSAANNVSIIDGKQVIEIIAKGGYAPRNTIAKANVPTVIKVKTNGTFDCSSALTIPSMKYRTFLAPSGEAQIDIPEQKEGASIKGICAMGMYSFTVKFN